MPTPAFTAAIDNQLRGSGLDTSTPITAVTGVSERVAAKFERDLLENDDRVQNKLSPHIDKIRELRETDLPRFEKTRRLSQYNLDGLRRTDYSEGLLPVSTVGEFIASTASFSPIPRSYRFNKAVPELLTADLDLERLGILSKHWLEAAFEGKVIHADLYTRDLRQEKPPATIETLRTRLWDPERKDVPVDVDQYESVGDIGPPIPVGDDEYVPVTATDSVADLLDQDRRDAIAWATPSRSRLEQMSYFSRLNYAAESVYTRHYRIAPEQQSGEKPITGILFPPDDRSGYCRRLSSIYKDSSVFFERLSEELAASN